MDARGSAYFLTAILVAVSASAARAEDAPRAQPAAEKVRVLQSQISDPADFKSFVEGSRRLPEGPAVPRAQLWPQSSGRAAVRSTLLQASLRARRLELGVIPPGPAAASQSPEPTSDNLPSLPLAGLALISLATAGLLALASKREFTAAPPAEVLPVEPATVAEISSPKAPITETASARRLLARLEAEPEPFVDTRMPVSTWRAISWREQQFIEMWDTSFEKSLGQPFAEWLDTQDGVEGVDAALLKAKLSRDV
ncbi:MAG: hypothetical protein NTY77_02160 [Elusimicrobia bacterium]|nr:hypothetical protein [Elusimicrobiota bacterium]